MSQAASNLADRKELQVAAENGRLLSAEGSGYEEVALGKKHGPWDFLCKNIGVGFRFLLQVIFLTQGSNSCHLRLLHW